MMWFYRFSILAFRVCLGPMTAFASTRGGGRDLPHLMRVAQVTRGAVRPLRSIRPGLMLRAA